MLCGPNQQGAQAVSCARHLATHNVLVTVFVADVLETTSSLETELELYDLTFGKKYSHCKGMKVCVCGKRTTYSHLREVTSFILSDFLFP